MEHLNTVLKFSGGIGVTGLRCPAYWPQCLQKMQKSMATSGMPSIIVFSMILKLTIEPKTLNVFKFVCSVY